MEINQEETYLDWDPSEYPLLQKTILSVEKFKTLWHLALNFHEKYEKWYYGPFKGLETQVIQKEVEQMYSTAVTSIKTFHDTPQARRIAETVRAKVEKFRTYLPILHTLCNPGMSVTVGQKINKVQAKKIVKSNKSISQNFILTKFHFFNFKNGHK